MQQQLFDAISANESERSNEIWLLDRKIEDLKSEKQGKNAFYDQVSGEIIAKIRKLNPKVWHLTVTETCGYGDPPTHHYYLNRSEADDVVQKSSQVIVSYFSYSYGINEVAIESMSDRDILRMFQK